MLSRYSLLGEEYMARVGQVCVAGQVCLALTLKFRVQGCVCRLIAGIRARGTLHSVPIEKIT